MADETLRPESRYREEDWTKIQTTKKLAAQRQIEAAIQHLQVGDFECAATLALAAEGMLPEPTGIHLFKAIKQQLPDKTQITILNDLRNWLKHPPGADTREVSEFEIAIALVRGVSKYFAVFGDKTPAMDEFVLWCVSKGLLRKPGPT